MIIMCRCIQQCDDWGSLGGGGGGAAAWFQDQATAKGLGEGGAPKRDSTPECMTLHQASPTDTKKLTNGEGASS